MKKIMLNLFTLLITFGMWQASAQTYNGAVGSIDDNTCATGTPTEFIANVPDAGTIGTDATLDNVTLDISHTWTSDLDITLISPSGTELELSTDNGGSDDNYTNTVFEDGGADITAASAPFTGTFEAEGGTFAATFAGESVTGDWILRACDDEGGISGTLNSWSVTFTLPVSSTFCTSDTPLNIDPPLLINAATTVSDTGSPTDTGLIGAALGEYAIASVDINIYSGWASELTFTLQSPLGTTLELSNRNGSIGSLNPAADLVFTDASTNDVTDWGVGAPMADYMPEGGDFASTFNGENINGDWSLIVEDVGFNDGGTLNSYCITFERSVATTAVCQDITIGLNATGDPIIITGSDIDGGSTATSGIASLVASPDTFDCSNVGANVVTLTVTDINGLSSICNATVTIKDYMPPTIVCPSDLTVTLDPMSCEFIVPDFTASVTVTDNCSYTVTQVPTAGTLVPSGTHLIVLTATDGAGNFDNCTSNLIVQDQTATCQDITVQLDASGNVTITAADVDGGTSTACGIASMTISPDTFDCSNVGPNAVTLTVTNGDGSVSSCTSTVTVEDGLSPIVAANQTLTAVLDASGNVILNNLIDVEPNIVASDNCGIDWIRINGAVANRTFDCSDIATNPNSRNLRVKDVNGNTTNVNVFVNVVDNTNPIALCQDIIVFLDGSGNASITGADIDNGSSDACGIASLVANPNIFDFNDIGVNTISLLVTDNNGNTSMCTSTVTIDGSLILPVPVCQDITLGLNATGDPVVITGSDIDGGSTAPNGIDFLTASPDTFDCSNVGANTVTLTVTDFNGLSSTCTAIVTIKDYMPPTIVCPGAQTSSMGVVPDLTAMATVTDNCNYTVTQVPLAGTIVSQGNHLIVITATDGAGNFDNCSVSFTVVPPAFLGTQENVLRNAINMYPNPANEQVIISNGSNIALESAMIFDINGKLIANINLQDMQSEKAIDISDFATGVYMVQITSGQASVVKRLIKE